MADRDDLPIFRPRLGGGRRPASGGGGASFRNALLAALRGARPSRSGAKAARSRVAVPKPGALARRVVVKAHVVRVGPSGAKAAALHLRYIERDGVEKDGSKGVLYTADGPALRSTFEEPRPGEKHQFRLIVSPEDAAELDLTDFVRRLMARVEQDLGRKLEWAAVNHYDTDHPHAHIVLRGVDRDGREVRLDRGYISSGLRGRAQELATEELGERHELDLRQQRNREVHQDRFTSLDRDLERRAKDHRVEVRTGRDVAVESTLVARLEHLEGLRLARRESPTAWVLTPDWQSQLRELGSRGDIIKQMHAALSGDLARYEIVLPGQALRGDTPGEAPALFGRVAAKGLSDELKGSFYAILETPGGRAYHVPLDARSADGVAVGDLVSFTTKPESAVRAVDRTIADAARSNGGVYCADSAASESAREATNRRLRELERLGLAATAGAGRWKVAADLVERLERDSGVSAARHRLVLRKEPLRLDAQVRHPGPVWLDRVAPATLAPYGLGADVHRALEQRREAVRALGIDPDDRSKVDRLEEMQRRAIGKEWASGSGQSFVAHLPGTFRGRVELVGPDAKHAAVSDGARFVVLRTTPALRAAAGKTIEVSQDARGRITVRALPDKDRGLP